MQRCIQGVIFSIFCCVRISLKRCQTRVLFLLTCCLSLVIRLVKVWTIFHSRVLFTEIWQQETACEQNDIQPIRYVQSVDQSSFLSRLTWDLKIKVSDFGLARVLEDGKDYYRMGQSGALPIRWMAIESIADFIFTTESDIVSIRFLLRWACRLPTSVCMHLYACICMHVYVRIYTYGVRWPAGLGHELWKQSRGFKPRGVLGQETPYFLYEKKNLNQQIL